MSLTHDETTHALKLALARIEVLEAELAGAREGLRDKARKWKARAHDAYRKLEAERGKLADCQRELDEEVSLRVEERKQHEAQLADTLRVWEIERQASEESDRKGIKILNQIMRDHQRFAGELAAALRQARHVAGVDLGEKNEVEQIVMLADIIRAGRLMLDAAEEATLEARAWALAALKRLAVVQAERDAAREKAKTLEAEVNLHASWLADAACSAESLHDTLSMLTAQRDEAWTALGRREGADERHAQLLDASARLRLTLTEVAAWLAQLAHWWRAERPSWPSAPGGAKWWAWVTQGSELVKALEGLTQGFGPTPEQNPEPSAQDAACEASESIGPDLDTPEDCESSEGPSDAKEKRWWVGLVVLDSDMAYFEANFSRGGATSCTRPWWVNGRSTTKHGEATTWLCVAVIAPDEEAARQYVRSRFDVVLDHEEWVFVVERPDGWSPFSERFPRRDWMVWPEEGCDA